MAGAVVRVGTTVRKPVTPATPAVHAFLAHLAAASVTPPPDARWDVVTPPDRTELVCHHGLAPWHLVCAGDRWVFIDVDGAGLATLGPRLPGPDLRPAGPDR